MLYTQKNLQKFHASDFNKTAAAAAAPFCHRVHARDHSGYSQWLYSKLRLHEAQKKKRHTLLHEVTSGNLHSFAYSCLLMASVINPQKKEA